VSEFFFPVDSCLVAGTIVVVKPTGYIGAKYAILDGQVAEL
jgi:hypothetical protein